MEGVIRYARLRMLRLRTADPAARLDALPAVRDVLENHLHPRVEPSRAVRAIYVTALHVLVWLDGAWFASLLPRIFPTGDEAMWESAWDSYIRWSGGFTESIVILLAAQYEKAVDAFLASVGVSHAPSTSTDQEGVSHERQRLANHIYIAAWKQVPALAATAARYQANAPAEDRAAGITSLGYALYNDEFGEPFRKDLDGLKRLWEARLGQLPDGDPELEAFAHWFASGYFNDTAGLELLNRTLLKTGGQVADDLYGVLGTLAACGASEPDRTYAALNVIAREPSEELRWLGDRMEAVLSAILGAADDALREKVVELIDHLEWRGYTGLSRLLTDDGYATGAPNTP
jgi:hypothetical protein